MLPLCCNTRQQANWFCRDNNSAETSEVSHQQADSAGWVQVGAGVAAAGRGLICGRVGDILSLLIIVWILCIFKYTFPWHKQYNVVTWHCSYRCFWRTVRDRKRWKTNRDGGQCAGRRQTIWSLRMRAIEHLEARKQQATNKQNISRHMTKRQWWLLSPLLFSTCNSAWLSYLHNMLRNLLCVYPKALITPQQSSPVLFCLTQQEAIKEPRSVFLSHEITLSLLNTGLFDVCLCKRGAGRESLTRSPLLWVVHKQGSMSQPTADLVSLMIRLRLAQTHWNKATFKRCVTCHGRLRCPEDKAAFGFVSVSRERGIITQEVTVAILGVSKKQVTLNCERSQMNRFPWSVHEHETKSENQRSILEEFGPDDSCYSAPSKCQTRKQPGGLFFNWNTFY